MRDIIVPAGITILDQLGDTVASVDAPRTDEQIAASEGAVVEDITKVKVEEKGKIDEEGAEGAAAAGGEAKKEDAKKEGGKKDEKKKKE